MRSDYTIFDIDYSDADYVNKRSRAIQKYFEEEKILPSKYIFVDKQFRKTLEENSLLESSIFSKEPLLYKIKGIPLGITQYGEVLVMPPMKEPTPIAIYGITGSGKTLMGHTIVDHTYNFQDYNAIILNDYHNECYPWTTPMHALHFRTLLKSFNYIDGIPLPIVLCLPDVIGEQTKTPLYEYIPKLIVNLPFKEFLENLENIYDLGESGKYYENVKDELKGCKNEEDFFETLEASMKLHKAHRGSKSKITNLLYQSIRNKLISFKREVVNLIEITSPEGKMPEDFYPIQLLKCNLIPVISTLKIFKKNYFSAYIKFILDEIIARMGSGDEILTKKNLLIFIDEMTLLTSVKEPTLISESIKDAVLSGRFFKTSLMISAQNASSIDEIIRNNCRYVFAFKSRGNDAKIIAEDMALTKIGKLKKEILNLKTHEFIAYTDQHHFQIYDVLGNKLRCEKGPIKCRIIPPLSHHIPRTSTKRSGREIWQGETDQIKIKTYASKILAHNKIKLWLPTIKGKNSRLLEVNTKKKDYKKFMPKIKSPKLIERFDYLKIFWGQEGSITEELEYEELRKNGWVICKKDFNLREKKDYYFILRKEENITPFVTPYLTNPPSNVQVIYDIYTKTIRLRGPKCSIKTRSYKF